MKARAQKKGRRLGTAGQFGRKTPNAGTGRRRGPPSTQHGCRPLRARRRISISRSQSSKHRSDRERPPQQRHTIIDSKASATSRIESHSIPRDVQLPGPIAPRESVSRHRCSLGWKRAPVRPLFVLSIHSEDLFGETVARSHGDAASWSIAFSSATSGSDPKGCRRLMREASLHPRHGCSTRRHP